MKTQNFSGPVHCHCTLGREWEHLRNACASIISLTHGPGATKYKLLKSKRSKRNSRNPRNVETVLNNYKGVEGTIRTSCLFTSRTMFSWQTEQQEARETLQQTEASQTCPQRSSLEFLTLSPVKIMLNIYKFLNSLIWLTSTILSFLCFLIYNH